MFKNLILFKITTEWAPNLEAAEEALQNARFVACGPTQLQSVGWVEPRGEAHGAMVEAVNGHWLVKFCVEKKVLPGSVVKRAVQERVAKIEEETGRRPGKKETREIKEEVILNLLPKAFTKMDTISAWIDPAQKLVVVDGSSVGKADAVMSALVPALEGIGMMLLQTAHSPVSSMSGWLQAAESPAPFQIDREAELKSFAEDKSVVKYSRHNLDIEEIKKHIVEGKVPVKLAMTWNGRVSFVLTDSGVIKKIVFLDSVFEDNASDDEDSFDADFAILTGEMSKMIPELVEALGGELMPAT